MQCERNILCLSMAAFILAFHVLRTHSQLGGNVNILFAELDASDPESASVVNAPVRIEGDNVDNFTLIATPLTAAQYKADPRAYRHSCNSLITDNSIDTAEAGDFDGSRVEILIPHHATGRYEINIPIPVKDDDIYEPTEYFLLVLDAQQSPATDLIRFTRGRQCIRVKITPDRDAISLDYESIVREVSEDAGTVEVFRVIKRGLTEQPVQVSFSGGVSNTFTISPTSIVLQPNETAAIVSITVTDDLLPENDLSSTISADSVAGSEQINVIIVDNDYVTIGFDQAEVTVLEGDTVSLSTSVKNNGLTIEDYFRTDLFEISTLQGIGNATASRHYLSTLIPFYFPGDPIEIQTIDDSVLERSRQFEVRITNSSSNPLNILEPSCVIVTIRDNDGIPNVPSITSLSLTDSDITINWMIDIHELRPVDKYLIQIQITGSNDQELNSGSRLPTSGDNQTTGANGASFGGSSRLSGQEFNVTVSVADLNCSINMRRGINHCDYALMQQTEIGETYSFIVCAINEFGTTCGESRNITATPPPAVTSSSVVNVAPITTTPPIPQPTPAVSTSTLTPQGTTSSTQALVLQGTLALSSSNMLSHLQTTTTQSLATPLPVPPPKTGPKTPTGLEDSVFVGIIFCVVVVVLLCCVVWTSIVLLCICCLRREREKNYWPEEKEKENEADLEKYRSQQLSESSDMDLSDEEFENTYA